MADNLRDLIAAVIEASIPDKGLSNFTDVADSVIQLLDEQLIAALMLDMGLRTEWGLLDHTESGLICDSFEEANTRKALPGESLHTRLVTDWVHVPQG